MRTLWIALAATAMMLLAYGWTGAADEKASLIKLEKVTDTKEAWAYGLKVSPPWADGGWLYLNYPEHLEYDGGRGIARYSDKRENAWAIAADGKSASYEVESQGVPGVKVKADVKVLEPDRVQFKVTIANNSERVTLDSVNPLMCHQYRRLTGFPQWKENLKHTYVVLDGKLTALADVPTEKADANVKGASIKGRPAYQSSFVKNYGGIIEKPLDMSLTVIESLDGKHAVLVTYEPGKSMLSNANIPCLHADPWFGDIKPGESKEVTGFVIFAGENWREIAQKMIDEHKAKE
jgi:hypothetical protein